MTTIAYRDGVLAADTQVNSGNGCRAGTIAKIGQTKDGCLWAFSGNAQMMAACVGWTEERKDDPPKDIEGVFVLIAPDGTYREWWGSGWLQVNDPQPAWGSGERIARGAMFAGADAETAVRAAIALDPESGGQVMAFRVARLRDEKDWSRGGFIPTVNGAAAWGYWP